MKQADMRTRTDFCAEIYSSNKTVIIEFKYSNLCISGMCANRLAFSFIVYVQLNLDLEGHVPNLSSNEFYP